MGGGKHAQGSRYDSANHPHAGCSLCRKTSSDHVDVLSLAAAAFPPASGQCNAHRHRIRISPEPVSRYGLSLARNSAFATITRSTFPTCTFATAQDNFANPFDLRLLRSASVSRPMQGDLIAGHPFPALISRTLAVSTASTPLRAIAALRIKAFNRSNRQKLTLPNARWPFLLPAAPSFDNASDRCFRTRCALLSKSFRKPWN